MYNIIVYDSPELTYVKVSTWLLSCIALLTALVPSGVATTAIMLYPPENFNFVVFNLVLCLLCRCLRWTTSLTPGRRWVMSCWT